MRQDFTPKIVNSLLLVLGWLLARLGLVLVEADELARLRVLDGRPVLPPGFRMFNAELAAAHGIDEAVMLSTFSGWIDHNVGKGRQPWTYNSAEKWVEQEFPWMSVSTYRRKVKKLGEAGLLDVCQQAQSFDRRLRVSLTTAARLNTSSSHAERPSIQNEQMMLPNWKDDLQDSEQTILSRKNSTPAAPAAHAPAKAAAAAPVICTVQDILDREATDRSADRDRDLEGGAIRHARKPGPSPVPAAPSPRPDELTTELDAQAEPVPAAIAAVFAPIVARQLIARYGTATVERALTVARERGAKNPAGFALKLLRDADPALEPHPPAPSPIRAEDGAGEGEYDRHAEAWLAQLRTTDAPTEQPADPARDAWRVAHDQLEIQLDRGNFQTWVRDAAFVRAESDRWTIRAAHSMARDQLQHRLYKDIRRVLSDVVGRKVEIEFVIAEARNGTSV